MPDTQSNPEAHRAFDLYVISVASKEALLALGQGAVLTCLEMRQAGLCGHFAQKNTTIA